MPYLLSVILLMFASLSVSQTSETIDIGAIIEQLKLNKSRIKRELITYKSVPNHPNEYIVIIPEIANEDADDVYFELNSHILIVNQKSGKIENRYFESAKTNNWYSDAVRLESISIDTAPFLLTDTIRAFGVRLYYYGSSRANPYSAKTLSLFIKQGKTLKPVLKDLSVYKYNGEWDTSCAGEFIDEKSILIMSKHKTNGFYDIQVKTKTTYSEAKEDENKECVETDRVSKQTSRLKFQDGHYIALEK